ILKKISNRSSDELFNFLKLVINKKSSIYTDKWRGYSTLNQYFAEHKTVNHSIQFVNPENGVHINTIEGCGTAIKSSVNRRHRVYRYIDIYFFHFVLNSNEGLRSFHVFLDLIIN
ncbi:hypothetical protein DMUE_5740, partial [Dictyocoela muelleri]